MILHIVIKKGSLMENQTPSSSFINILNQNMPFAMAWIQGNDTHRGLNGLVRFYPTPYEGILIDAQIFGLPDANSDNASQFYGMHIHEFGNCDIPFDKTGNHYNPTNMPHPDHAGDLPPLLSNHGYAWQAFYDKRFAMEDIIGKSVVIHGMRDDFTSQPSGGSGEKIGCGVIKVVRY